MKFSSDITGIHSEGNGSPSWMRYACSLVVITGCVSIILQLLIAAIVAIWIKDLAQFSNIEWMQPITLIGVALTGKTVQKKIEKPNGNNSNT